MKDSAVTFLLSLRPPNEKRQADSQTVFKCHSLPTRGDLNTITGYADHLLQAQRSTRRIDPNTVTTRPAAFNYCISSAL